MRVIDQDWRIGRHVSPSDGPGSHAEEMNVVSMDDIWGKAVEFRPKGILVVVQFRMDSSPISVATFGGVAVEKSSLQRLLTT